MGFFVGHMEGSKMVSDIRYNNSGFACCCYIISTCIYIRSINVAYDILVGLVIAGRNP